MEVRCKKCGRLVGEEDGFLLDLRDALRMAYQDIGEWEMMASLDGEGLRDSEARKKFIGVMLGKLNKKIDEH